MTFLRNVFVACLLVAAPAFAAEEEEVSTEPAGEDLKTEFLEATKVLARKFFAPSDFKIEFEKSFKEHFLKNIGLPEDEHMAEVTRKFLDYPIEREKQLLPIYEEMQRVKGLLDAVDNVEEEEALRQRMRDLIREYKVKAYKLSTRYEYGPQEEDSERFETFLSSYIEASNIPLVLEQFTQYT